MANNTTTIEAKDLQKGQYFKLPKQRKYRYAQKVLEVAHPQRGQIILVITDNCKQILLDKDDQLQIQKAPTLA
ncbi:MAG: hypothetical protein GY810_16545 [Aureispira sp.]|nr:hypothetical protein [Aureispira sp.]